MAGKFVIYCDDDCPTKAGLEEKQITISQLQAKREPLGIRQTISQSTVAQPSSSSINDFNEEDQENDISMASLGSEYAPSIANDFDLSCEEISDDELNSDDEQELNEAFKKHEDSQLFKNVEYQHDIKGYLHRVEKSSELRPEPDYMDLQDDVDSDKRTILINWLVEVAEEFELQTETLFMSTSIVDRFLSKMSIRTDRLQLLGVAAMFTASKYEEIYPPTLNQFMDITAETCSGPEIIQMEQEILKTLNFQLSLPTISYFLKHLFAFNKFPKEVYHLADYLCHLSLLHDKPFLHYYPSEIALAAVILAARQLNAGASISPELESAYDKSNNDQLKRGIGAELPFCIEAILKNEMQKRINNTSVYHKFSKESHGYVALSAAKLVEEFKNNPEAEKIWLC